jgi:5'-nucleotidase
MRILTSALLFLLVACAARDEAPQSPTVTLSIIGTNDVHGALLPKQFNGGLASLSGYVAALRAARAEDGGAVLLIDAGDMWQGSLESNLVEGATVVEIYNAIGYTAATIGNHEFDFGPIGELAIPASSEDDPQGALRQRIKEAQFPILSANIVDTRTGELIDWENVAPSTMIETAGVKVGIIGLVTEHALKVTIAANAVGLEIAPLAEAIVREATGLREQGADIVIVTAHAGSQCTEFNDPLDLSSCDRNGEIVRVANALPKGLVDHIIAGHVHQGMAHIVNGIAITSSYSNTYAFDRVDFSIDRASGQVVERKVFPPQVNCPAIDRASKECAWTETDPERVEPASYEGRIVEPMASVERIVAGARANAAAIKSELLGVTLVTPFDLDGNPESPLANLFTDAVLDGVEADIAIHNVSGGIRATLPAGDLTYGKVFEIFPFDNRVAFVDVSGAQLRRIISAQAMKRGRRAGFSGMRVYIACANGVPQVDMILNNGKTIADDDQVRLAVNDFLVTLGDNVLTPAEPAGGFKAIDDPRLTRDLLVQWFRKQGGSLSAEDFDTEAEPRWNISESFVTQCQHGV